jgi:hypothetical protein
MGKKLKQGGNRTVAKALASKSVGAAASKSSGKSGHTKAQPVPASLEGRVRLRTGHLLTLYGVAHSTLYDRLRAGRIPRADGDDGRPWWWQESIRADLEQ